MKLWQSLLAVLALVYFEIKFRKTIKIELNKVFFDTFQFAGLYLFHLIFNISHSKLTKSYREVNRNTE